MVRRADIRAGGKNLTNKQGGSIQCYYYMAGAYGDAAARRDPLVAELARAGA